MFQSRKSKNIVINIGDDVINIGCDWVQQQKKRGFSLEELLWVKF